MEEFVKVEEEVKDIQAKLRNTVDVHEFETELDKIWAHFKTFKKF